MVSLVFFVVLLIALLLLCYRIKQLRVLAVVILY